MFFERLKTGLPSMRDIRDEQSLRLPNERPLSLEESELLTYVLQHGDTDAKSFQWQIPFTTVVSKCDCGCPTIGLEVAKTAVTGHATSRVIVDLQGLTYDGHAVGLLVFADSGFISQLEVYDYEDIPRPFSLPILKSLSPFRQSSVI